MEISSLRISSSISSLIHRRSSRHCFSFSSNPRPSFCAGFGQKAVVGWEDRFGRVLRSKEDYDEDLGFDEEERNEFWNPLSYLEDLKLKADSDFTYKAIVYGSASLVTLLVTSAVTSALHSIPLVPKLMEVIGLGFTVWFSFRYLVFKENRDELFAKIEDVKKRIF